MRIKLAFIACFFLSLAAARAEDWPRWRGPHGNAVSDETPLPVKWGPNRNVEWKASVEGEGFSSPIIAGDCVFLTSSLDYGARRLTHCLNRSNGRLRWTREIEDDDPEVASSMTGHAAATPAAAAGKVVAMFGRAGLVCYDEQGQKLWHVRLGRFESELGLASSPVIDGQRVFVVCDHDGDRFNSFDSYVLAVNLADGATLWKTERRDLYRSWSTPIVVPFGQSRQLLVNAQDELRAYDPNTGELIWSLGGMTGWVTPSPVFGRGLIFATSGKSGPVMAVAPIGKDKAASFKPAWSVPSGGPYVCSPLLYGKYLYVHNEAGVLTCHSAADGKIIYRQRLAGKFTASGAAGDGKMYFTNQEGTTYVVRAGAEFELLAENRLDEYTLASPAISGGRLFLRTQADLILYRAGNRAVTVMPRLTHRPVPRKDARCCTRCVTSAPRSPSFSWRPMRSTPTVWPKGWTNKDNLT